MSAEMSAEIDDRAKEHREQAERRITSDMEALIHALLAIEARLEEIAYYVAQAGPG